MSNTHNKAELPPNPTLKEINWYKKQVNWGELPPFYHLVASSVGEAEGVLKHGFDNAIKRLIDKRNWNLKLLDGTVTETGIVDVQKKPRISLYSAFNDRGFEIQAYPFAKDREVDQYIKEHPHMEFLLWDPASMKQVLRINQLHKFIHFYFQRGDEADKALIIHAHKVVHNIIEFLKAELNVVKVDGVTIKQFYELCEHEFELHGEALELSSLRSREPDKE